jgi:hypothetical protein
LSVSARRRVKRRRVMAPAIMCAEMLRLKKQAVDG